jgi:hypothetical protein
MEKKRLRLRTPNGGNGFGICGTENGEQRRDRAGANIAISEQLIINALVKDHAAALGVRNFRIQVRLSEVLISAMWHPRVGADATHRWLRYAVTTARRRVL